MIWLHGVSYAFPGGPQALADLDLEVSAGELLVVCGANGCGKSTLLRLMKGLVEPDAGEVSWRGEAASADARRREVGLVFQDAESQIIGETVALDVAFGPENQGLDAAEVRVRVEDALRLMGLAELESRVTHQLSGGEKRRLALAGVLAMRPALLLLDEPFTHLDLAGSRDLMRRLLELHAAGIPIVVATHDVADLAPYADRLAVLAFGRLAALGSLEEVRPRLEPAGVRPPGGPWLRAEDAP